MGDHLLMINLSTIHLISMFACHPYKLVELFNYRSLISRLEEVDLRKMKHEEKIAFWINIHNALVMHVMIHLD